MALAAIATAGAIALHALVDPDRVKSLARDKARAAWSRELTMRDVSIHVFPLPSLGATDVALSGRDGESAFFRAKHVGARLDLLALFTGKARLRSLDIEDAWVKLEPKDADVPDVSPETTRRATGTPQLLDLTDLYLENVALETGPADARVRWQVAQADFSAERGWRDATIDARIARNDQPLRVRARLADLSRVGATGAATDGEIDLAFARTQVSLKGRIPLDHSLAQAALHADLKTPSLDDVFAFYALERRSSTPAEAHFDLRAVDGRLELSNLDLVLGDARARGGLTLATSGAPRRLDGKVTIERLDWAKAMADAGRPTPPKRDTGLAFNPDALAWPLLEKLDGWRGVLDADVGLLKLRNGVEMRNARFHFAFDGNRLDVDPVQAELLGGKGSARMHFDGGHKTVKVAFDAAALLLERWYHERGRPIPFTGGPMNIHADFTSTGNTMRELAATVTGPVTVRMGPGAWNSKHAGDTEALMTNAFASEGAQKVQFACVTANLPFRSGVAHGRSIVGFRTEASELITSGSVNLRDESLDLHGRVRANKGVTLGLAQIAGDVKIGGHLTRPEMSLDPQATPGVIARAGAAIATLGMSVIGSALIERMEPDHADPCADPVRKKDGSGAGR